MRNVYGYFLCILLVLLEYPFASLADDMQFSIVIDNREWSSQVFIYEYSLNSKEKSLTLYSETSRTFSTSLNLLNETEISVTLESIKSLVDENVPASKRETSAFVFVQNQELKELDDKYTRTVAASVQQYFEPYHFQSKFKEETFLEDAEEGVLSWFAVNLLKGVFFGVEEPVAVVTLETTSSHVGFVPNKNDYFDPSQKKHYQKFKFQTDAFWVYFRDFHNLGIYEARKSVIVHQAQRTGSKLYSDCFNPNGDSTLGILNEIYTTHDINFGKCTAQVRRLLQGLNPIPNLSGKDIYGVDNFQKILRRANVAGSDSDVFEQTVEEVSYLAEKKCDEKNPRDKFLCFDLIYVKELLKEVFGLQNGDKIKFLSRMSKCQVNWVAGLAYLNYYSSMLADDDDL